jgi:hypothetical protein
MAPLPKPPGHRRRERPTQGRWRTLPPDRPFKRPPPLPTRKPAWLKATRSWWQTIWSSPMASVWIEADVPALIRLAEMVEARARGKLGATETVAMTALEDRFGLSPKARRALQWEVSQAEQAEPARIVNVPKLRAVESG